MAGNDSADRRGGQVRFVCGVIKCGVASTGKRAADKRASARLTSVFAAPTNQFELRWPGRIYCGWMSPPPSGVRRKSAAGLAEIRSRIALTAYILPLPPGFSSYRQCTIDLWAT